MTTDGFNSDAFYRSSFQPEIFYDQHGKQRVEMKLDVQNYEPNEIKVHVDGNDLIVKAEHSSEHPPNSSSRAYFFKQITLPPNCDLSSITSQFRAAEKKLYITASLRDDKTNAIRYN